MIALVETSQNYLVSQNVGVEELVGSFLDGRSERTIETYGRSLKVFAGWLGVENINDAAKHLLSLDMGAANYLVTRFRSWMISEGIAPNTINSRLSAIRSLVQLARKFGIVAWALEVDGVRAQNYRDTAGPGEDGFLAMVEYLEEEDTDKNRRDLAILRLLFDVALRRESVVGIDMEDLDLENGQVWVKWKGEMEKKLRTLPPETVEAIRDWLEIRGVESGPVFVSISNRATFKRLTGRSVHRIISEVGEAVGLDTWPHGLRHAAITKALDVTNGDVRGVADFSGHKKYDTLYRYDDNRRNRGGEIACMVARREK